MLWKKKKEELTPEEYRQQAQEEMQNLKNQWKTFFRTGIFLFAAVAAMIILGIAWFVSNNKVAGTGTSISASGSDFDLAADITGAASTKGKGMYDELLDVPSGTETKIKEQTFLATNDTNDSITWAITDDSNLNNQTDANGIEPGSSGSLTFYIISHKDGPLSLTLDVTLTGYSYSGKDDNESTTSADITQLKSDDKAQKLLEGHVLLFAGYDSDTDSDTKSYKAWISEDAEAWTRSLDKDADGKTSVSLSRDADGKLTWTAENAVKETAYPVTLYWIWPERLESYIMSAEAYTGRRPLLFPDDTYLPQKFFTTMCTADDSNRYFRWKEVETFKTTVTPAVLSNMRTNFNPVIYKSISEYYNLADQYLGENVRYIKLKVEAR